MNQNYHESLYIKRTAEGLVRIPYSFPYSGTSEEIKEWKSLVKKLNN